MALAETGLVIVLANLFPRPLNTAAPVAASRYCALVPAPLPIPRILLRSAFLAPSILIVPAPPLPIGHLLSVGIGTGISLVSL